MVIASEDLILGICLIEASISLASTNESRLNGGVRCQRYMHKVFVPGD